MSTLETKKCSVIMLIMTMFTSNPVTAFNPGEALTSAEAKKAAVAVRDGPGDYTATWGSIGEWNMAGVTDAKRMFTNAKAFNADIAGWNMAALTNARYMFAGASAFNADIAGWNMSAMTNAQYMFLNAYAFNADIADWNMAAMANVRGMFRDAKIFNADIAGWNMAALTDASGMFENTEGTSAFNRDLVDWNLSSVQSCSNFCIPLCGGPSEQTPPCWTCPSLESCPSAVPTLRPTKSRKGGFCA